MESQNITYFLHFLSFPASPFCFNVSGTAPRVVDPTLVHASSYVGTLAAVGGGLTPRQCLSDGRLDDVLPEWNAFLLCMMLAESPEASCCPHSLRIFSRVYLQLEVQAWVCCQEDPTACKLVAIRWKGSSAGIVKQIFFF